MSMHINAILVFRTEYEKPEHQQQVLDYEVWTIHADISSISNCSRSRPRPKLVSQHRDLGVQDRDFHNRVSRTIILRMCVCSLQLLHGKNQDYRSQEFKQGNQITLYNALLPAEERTCKPNFWTTCGGKLQNNTYYFTCFNGRIPILK